MKKYIIVIFLLGFVFLSAGCQQEPVKDNGAHSESNKNKKNRSYGNDSYGY